MSKKQTPYAAASASLPKELKDDVDYVLWTAFDAKKKEVGKWTYTACYASIMNRLGAVEIHCRPWKRGSFMSYNDRGDYVSVGNGDPFQGRASALQYARFMRLLTRHRIALPGVRAFTDPEHGNSLLVPREGWDRHTVYILLCLYRWQDVKSRTMYTTLALMDRLRDKGHFLPFLQCLHYVMCARTLGDGHSFLPVQGGNAKNPALGWAWAHFNRLPGEARAKLEPKTDTTSMLLGLSEKLNPPAEKTSRRRRYWYEHTEPKLQLEDTSDLLHPRFSPLYTHPEQFGPEEFRKLIEEK